MCRAESIRFRGRKPAAASGSALQSAIFALLTVITAVPAQAAEPTARPRADPVPVATTEPDTRVTLRYRGFVAGAPVGEATVAIALEDGHYRVRGVATSNNWLRGFTDWRNEFRAAGRLEGLQRQTRAFEYTETDRDKSRHVIVEDGQIQVTKNGKPRARRQAPGFPDVVSALFVRPHCAGDQTVTTGRHVYALARLDRAPGGCRYVVTDDDGDTFEMSLTLGRRGTLVVPTRITVYGWLTGWIELEEHRPGESG